MNIGFALGKISGSEPDLIYTLVDVAHDYPSIRKAQRIGLYGHSQSFYSFIRCLELNPDFERKILSARKALGIPSKGKPFSKYFPFSEASRLPRKTLLNYFTQIPDSEDFDYPRELWNCFYDIIFYNIVSPFSAIQTPITWRASYESVNISIHTHATKNAVHTFIDNNWKLISAEVSRLGKQPTADFSAIRPMDFEIVGLRDNQKLSFAKIADKLQAKYGADDYDSKINEDSVKTAYTRIKKKIAGVFKPKK